MTTGLTPWIAVTLILLGALFCCVGTVALKHPFVSPYPNAIRMDASLTIGAGSGFLILGVCFGAMMLWSKGKK
jgi:multisubunit Na+/H+ antiporter MnhG subunit